MLPGAAEGPPSLLPMRSLVVYAHPDPRSYGAAVRDRAVSGLTTAGHDVELIDLYGIDYQPCLSADEYGDYYTIGLDHTDPVVAGHIEQLRNAEALIFVYPTWWSGLPAILKGWLERTMLPEVAFSLAGQDGAHQVTPLLDNVRRLIGITTYGSPRPDLLVLGDAGRRTLTRTVRLMCHRRCRTSWLGLHRVDSADAARRADFLHRVESKVGNLR